MKDIRKLVKKKVLTDEIQQYIGIDDYREFVRYMDKMVNDNILAPVKSSGINGKKPALYQAYHIRYEKKERKNIEKNYYTIWCQS